MNCQFSETQFSFSFTFEFINKYCSWASIPFFPSTVLEGREGYGYDVKINGSLFFQYKIPQYISRKNYRSINQWNKFNRPFFRCSVNTNGEQYKLLKSLKNFHNEVCYITPEFYRISDISDNYLQKRIVEKSAIFPIEFLPNYGAGMHSLCYMANQNIAHMFSESFQLKKLEINSIITKFIHNEESSLIGEAEFIISTLKEVLQIEIPKFIKEYSIIQFAQNILIAQFNILWIPLIIKKTTPN